MDQESTPRGVGPQMRRIQTRRLDLPRASKAVAWTYFGDRGRGRGRFPFPRRDGLDDGGALQ